MSQNQKNETTELYGTVAIRENRLERWPNPQPERPYLISLDIPEFTCLCPRSGFPDFALIKIRYQPKDWIVELKSLKLYINGYRDRHISHEAAANQILNDLVALLEPRWIRVVADFNVRGNIKTVIRVEHGVREGRPTEKSAGGNRAETRFQDNDAEDRSRYGLADGGSIGLTHCVLLSGGLDSATLVAWVKNQHPSERVVAYTFVYGQKHAVEVEAAQSVANYYGIEHHVVEIPVIHGSALTEPDIPLPEGRDLSRVSGVAPSYVPARNLVFLAQMAAVQDAVGPGVLWLGVHYDDHTGYPDTRPQFVQAVDQAVRQGTKHGLRVQAPFVTWSKAQIIRWGLEHGVPYELTHSCYQGLRPACGVCDTCQARLKAFAEAGVQDPIPYAAR